MTSPKSFNPLSILDEDHLSQTQHTSFAAHGSSVITHLSLLPDGRIITASDDHTVQIHSTSGEKIHVLEGHSGGIWCLDTYEDTLVTGSTDRTIRVWDMKQGKCTHVFPGHTSTVRALQVVRPELVDIEREGGVMVKEEWPKKLLIVSGSRDHDIRIWGLPRPDDAEYHPDLDAVGDDPETSVAENPYHIHRLEGHEHAIRDISARGRTCVSASYDCTLRVWDIVTGDPLLTLTGHTQKVYIVQLDLPRQQVYSGSMDGSVIIWDLKSGAVKHRMQGHNSLVGLVYLTPSYVISGSADGRVCVTDPTSGKLIHRTDPVDSTSDRYGTTAITSMVCDDSGVVFGSDKPLCVLDIERKVVKKLAAVSRTWAIEADDAYLVTACSENDATMVHVWERRQLSIVPPQVEKSVVR